MSEIFFHVTIIIIIITIIVIIDHIFTLKLFITCNYFRYLLIYPSILISIVTVSLKRFSLTYRENTVNILVLNQKIEKKLVNLRIEIFDQHLPHVNKNHIILKHIFSTIFAFKKKFIFLSRQ